MKWFLDTCLSLFCRFVFLLPRKVSRGLFSLFGFFWFDLFQFRKKIVLDNLKIAFPDLSLKEREKIGRQSVYNLMASLADFFIIPFIDQKWIETNVVYHGVENMQKALSLDKGVFVLSLHMGNGDLSASLIQLQKFKLFLITKFFKNKIFNDIWFRIRGAQGVSYIEPHGEKTPFQILKALKSNALVVFVLDQYMGKPFGLETSFFGRKTGTAKGLALFYLKTKSPIIPVYCYEGQDDKYHVVYEPQLELNHLITEDKDKTLLDLTQKFCHVTESFIRKHPDQWMWIHRRWKNFND
ncbi:MAG: lipid A biosynthesis lauroyl acyltransferase [Deltaproteobacteria bacterium]|jgi:KDO2-lipid IV(A) lauroyltransferase|nr:lipid A biosynthesis lauroyl acyltransferase [Deltaproteobacteria bacterium]